MALRRPGEESGRDEPGRTHERHHHLQAYAALVIHGTCEEAGDRGRFRAQAGDVLIHRAFDAHGDRIGVRGAVFLNFSLDRPLSDRFGTVSDVDAIVRAAERDPHEAAALLHDQFRKEDRAAADWPDLLAEDLAGASPPHLVEWADRHGLHPVSVSRGFRRAYGVSPKRFRLERIASRAARRIRGGDDPLSRIAAEAGFADQAHMTRTMVQLFGLRPSALRAAS